MTNQLDKAQQLRALHVKGRPLILFNCWDVGSAKAIAAAGAPALATASWAVAAANGYADGEQIPLDLALANVARITQAVELPVTMDLESGYGPRPQDVAVAVQRAIDAGAVGCNLEDSDAQAGGIRPAQDQALRLATARAAAASLCAPFFINARADAFLRSDPASHDAAMLAGVVARARLYAEHGADGLFVPGLTDPGLIGQLVQASPLPVNLMASDALPSLAQLRELGVARISHGPRAYLAAMKQLQEAARVALG